VLFKTNTGQTRQRLLAASGTAVLVVSGLAITGVAHGVTASRGTTSRVTAPSQALAAITVSPEAILMNEIKPEQPYTTAQCNQQMQISCYTPTQIQQAYGLPSLYSAGITGKGTTIVIVDAYGSPTISADLAEFDNEANVPNATLNILRPLGHVASFDQNNAEMIGWAGETTLDVEWSHAIAPGATIDLLEVPSGSMKDLTGGIKYALTHRLGDVISQSWGDAEQDMGKSVINYLHKEIYSQSVWRHITVVASAGDQGVTQPKQNGGYYDHPEQIYPGTDPDVVSVGGTNLDLGSGGNRLAADTVWNDTYNNNVNEDFYQSSPPTPTATGGGYSTMFGRPSYQYGVRNVVGHSRGVPDISMSASCAGSVQVYQSFPPVQPGWNPVCGTSESAPIFAGIVALADQKAGHSLGFINPTIYQLSADHAKGIVLVTSGNNTVGYTTGSGTNQQTVTVHGYYARHGYSVVAGVGTINGQQFVYELAHPGSAKSPGKGHGKKPVKKKHNTLWVWHARPSRLPSPGWPP
jgi:subtilase family serine protease